jgi:hypothetical protein
VKVDYGYQDWHNNRSLHTKVYSTSICKPVLKRVEISSRRSTSIPGCSRPTLYRDPSCLSRKYTEHEVLRGVYIQAVPPPD